MKFLRSVVLPLLILALPISAFSQLDTISLNSLVQKAVSLSERQPKEKVHLHFDKPYYAVGDTVWFKAYLASNLNIPTPLSRIVYIDVITEKDSLVETLRLPVNKSVAIGNLTLAPLTYQKGNYRFRAYTRWMFNFGEDGFFNKVIPVGSAINNQMITHVSFNGTNQEKSSQLNARILFKDKDGTPYADKRVNWRIISEYETLSKGRGTTDGQGYLTISGTAPQKIAPEKGKLETVLEVSNTKSLTNLFSLQSAFKEADVQFFPEGGKFMIGVSTRVAFKAIKSDGLGVDIKGVVTDNLGKEVTTFQSQHLGMGALTMIPEKDKTYKANVTFPDGSKATYNLPKPQSYSAALVVTGVDTSAVTIRINTTPAYLERYAGKNFYIIAQSGGVICYAAQTPLQSLVYSANIPASKFPPGIVQLTLLTDKGIPVSERLVFIRPASKADVVLSSAAKAYGTKQKVKLNVAPGSGRVPVEGTYSIAVVDETKVPFNEDDEISIHASFLLNSDLKGYVEKPNYYFNKPDAKKDEDLDILMMTQGYRSFSYRDLITDKQQEVFVLPEQGIDITGTLRYLSGMPVANGSVQFLIPESNLSVNTTTDQEGKFRFSNLSFPDSSQATISARNNVNSKNMMIMVDGMAFPAVTRNLNYPDEVLNIDSNLNAYLQNSKRQYRTANLLEEVVIKARSTVKKPSHADHPALSGLSMFPDHLIPGERFSGCNVLLECLKTGAMGLTYMDNYFYVNRDYNQGNRTPVQVFLNGMPIDVPHLATIDPSTVESVEIFLKDDLGMVNRTYNTNGVMVVNTKQLAAVTGGIKVTDINDILPKTNILDFTPMGYRKARQFYSPKYEGPRGGVISSDLRTTIYWNPMIFTDKEGKASVEYYNADGKGSYRAVIEGFDAEGNLSRYIYRYTVK